MKVDIITIFPELFKPFLKWSMIKKARKIKAVKIETHNLRKWAVDKRGSVDDRPYGGGPGMILRIEPIYNAIQSLKPKTKGQKPKIILLSAKGKNFDQKMAQELSQLPHIILVCGHYEGVDERIRKHMIDEEISIGNYILSGGEIPAMVVIDTISRLLPGVLAKEGAAEIESFSPGLKKLLQKTSNLAQGTIGLWPKKPCLHRQDETQDLIEFPQYTRPENFRGWKVPKVLLSGNHQKIANWQTKKIKSKKS